MRSVSDLMISLCLFFLYIKLPNYLCLAQFSQCFHRLFVDFTTIGNKKCVHHESMSSPKKLYIHYIITYMDVSKNRATPKWMVKIMGNPIKMDDLEVLPLFLETPIYHSNFACLEFHFCKRFKILQPTPVGHVIINFPSG